MTTKYGISRIFSSAARNTAQAPSVECPKCHETYVMGVTGISTGCDKCEGVTRDAAGFAWQDSYGQCTCLDYAGDDKRCVVHGKG